MKDVIEDKELLFNFGIWHEGVQEPSRIFCNKVEYIHNRGEFMGNAIFDHHLMFWQDDKLVFKVWLPNDLKVKEYEGVEDALKKIDFIDHRLIKR